MATLTGKSMTLKSGASAISGAHKFSISIEGDDAEYVDNTTAGWFDNAEGPGKWSGTFEINAQAAATCPVTKGQVVAATFYDDSTAEAVLTGNLRVSKVDYEVDAESNKVLNWVITFKGKGKPTGAGVAA